MARMNISVPDSLYERLDRLRDRVNASKVCTGALEKELDMLEARPTVADPELERLVQRLQGTKERWYQRGRQDGRRWALDTANREELQRVATQLGEMEAQELVHLARGGPHFFHLEVAPPPGVAGPLPAGPLPPGVPPRPDVVVHAAPPAAMPFRIPLAGPVHAGPGGDVVRFVRQKVGPPSGPHLFPRSFPLAEQMQKWMEEDRSRALRAEEAEAAEAPVLPERVDVDEAAYLDGWRDAVTEIWQAVAPALR